MALVEEVCHGGWEWLEGSKAHAKPRVSLGLQIRVKLGGLLKPQTPSPMT